MPGTSPLDILRETNPDAIPADSPPPAANYREVELQGVACANCAKFVLTGFSTDNDGNEIPAGYCSQWEANVRGDFVSDGFSDPGPAFDPEGNEVWDFADNERIFAEVLLAGTDASTDEETGFVVKEVLRTGEWPVIPVKGGKVNKPLRVVRGGKSSAKDGTIAMEELVANFKGGAIQNPQIPLSDDGDDHKNITRVNTGFVRDLWIVDEGEGSKLVAKMEFTEPEVREKVLRGTYADVSCGIPWGVRSRGKQYGATLEHVAITNRPFIDGLGPFLAMSDQGDEAIQIVAFGELEPDPPEDERQESSGPPAVKDVLDAFEAVVLATDSIDKSHYGWAHREGDKTVFLKNKTSNTAWMVPFENSDEGIAFAEFSDWEVVEDNEGSQEPAPRGTELSELEQAHRLRTLRLSQQTSKRAKEGRMPLTREEIDALELSDDTRAAMLSILDENASLRATTREAEADRRVEELKDLGLKDRPGFLKLYRQVHLSDDGGPAVVLLSDSGQEKERLSALEILDRAVVALKGSDEKIELSAQHIASGNDDKPPADADGETKTVEERLAEAKRDLYGSSAK